MDSTPSPPRPRRFRAGLLLGVAFLAGVSLGPVAGRLGAHFGFTFGLAPRRSPMSPATATPTGC